MSLLIGTSAGAFALGESPEPLIEGTRINHIRRGPESWWVVDGKGRIHRDGTVVAKMPNGATPLCLQPAPDNVWIGANQARLYSFDRGKVEEDSFFADAPGRGDWYTPWGAPADIRSMTVDAGHTLFINVHVGGILRYDNTGIVPTLDISADVHQVAAHPTRRDAVFAATAMGLAQSHNGHDFDFRTEGLHANYCRAILVLEDEVWISASTGPRTRKGRLYRGPLWEGPLEPSTEGLPDWFDDNLNTHCLVSHEGSIYAGLHDKIWRLDDEGIWHEAAGGLPQITCLA